MNMKQQLAIQAMYSAKKNKPAEDIAEPAKPAVKKPVASKSKAAKPNG